MITILFAVLDVSAQSYTVTYLKGEIYYDQKPVKMHDRLNGTALLTSRDKLAELGLFNLQKGRLRLTFVNSKPVEAKQIVEQNALYKLIIADNLQTFTTEKTLTTRGDFDLKTYLNYIDNNDVLFVENERLPLKSHFMTISATDKFFICRATAGDTICNPVPIAAGGLVFDASIFKYTASGTQIPCLVKFGGTRNGLYTEMYLTGQVNVTFLSKDVLMGILETFNEGWDTYYQHDKQKLLTDAELQLTYNYGDYYKPAVEEVLTEILDRIQH
ncbi:MAG: hypothetical protein ABI166_00730 [Mucilaginibacter sp.]